MQAEMAANYGLIMAGAPLAAVLNRNSLHVFQNPSLKGLLWELSKDNILRKLNIIFNLFISMQKCSQ